ncbi:MAG: flagellin FliC [Magnetococcales bacterium]|nr:flagellin FliC [Magnetococcales bacterium]
MGFSINTNLASLNAVRRLNSSSNGLNRSFERLSSGLRVNGSRDDAAGLAISNRLTAQIRGMSMAIRNTNDGISMVQVAEGALDETTNALQRMRELAIQAANGSLGSTDRQSLDLEVKQLVSEIQRISTTTTFNGVLLIDGHLKIGTSATFQVGANVGETLKLSIGSAGKVALSVSNTNVSTATAASHALTQIDNGLDAVSDIRANLGAYQNRFESIISNLSNVVENTSSARSRIMDADIAAETTNLTKFSILQQAGVAILAQANQQPQIALRLLQ